MREDTKLDAIPASPALPAASSMAPATGCPRVAAALTRAVAALNQAIVLLDAANPGNADLSLAAAHAETALLLAEAELAQMPRG